MIVGIDNGLDGGLCAISKQDASIIDYTAMPTFERKEKREIDVIAIREWLRDINIKKGHDIVIEEPLKHAKSSQAMRSMGISFGTLAALARLIGHEPYCMEVRDWHKPMLGRFKKGQSKIAALKKARQLEPDELWLKNDRCRTPHDGIIDAYLIAYFYWQKFITHENKTTK